MLVFFSVPRAGVEPASREGHDFKSCAYTNSAIQALDIFRFKTGGVGRNRTGAWRFCKPQRYHFATTPFEIT